MECSRFAKPQCSALVCVLFFCLFCIGFCWDTDWYVIVWHYLLLFFLLGFFSFLLILRAFDLLIDHRLYHRYNNEFFLYLYFNKCGNVKPIYGTVCWCISLDTLVFRFYIRSRKKIVPNQSTPILLWLLSFSCWKYSNRLIYSLKIQRYEAWWWKLKIHSNKYAW